MHRTLYTFFGSSSISSSIVLNISTRLTVGPSELGHSRDSCASFSEHFRDTLRPQLFYRPRCGIAEELLRYLSHIAIDQRPMPDVRLEHGENIADQRVMNATPRGEGSQHYETSFGSDSSAQYP